MTEQEAKNISLTSLEPYKRGRLMDQVAEVVGGTASYRVQELLDLSDKTGEQISPSRVREYICEELEWCLHNDLGDLIEHYVNLYLLDP
jgi:hypothetical protein